MAGSCPSIDNLSISNEGSRALNDIKRIMQNADILQKAMLGGTLVNALLSDKAIPMSFNVNMTDWQTLALAVKSVPGIAQNRIQNLSGRMALRTRGKENVFWKAMYDLCMFN